jgi:hypothetical protein
MVLYLLVFKYQKAQDSALYRRKHPTNLLCSQFFFPKCNFITAVSKYLEFTKSLNNSLFLQKKKKKKCVLTGTTFIFIIRVQQGEGKCIAL